jgi:membrane-associated protein
MVRRRHRNETKVLLVDPAQASRGFHRAGTLGGLAPTSARRIMRPYERDPYQTGQQQKDRFQEPKYVGKRPGYTNYLPSALSLSCCHAESLVAGMCAKSSNFLLPYWLGPAGSSLPIAARREPTAGMLELIRSVLHNLYDVQGLIQWGGILLVCIIVFVETGLFVGFFLPGDSLLVTAGVFTATGVLKIGTLAPVVTLCAFAGDQLGYWIGRRAGQALYRRQDSAFFKRRHLERAHSFYEKYGGKTVILARFVPIVRTFCPPVAGAAQMRYARYVAYDIVGACCWGGGLTLGGYFIGKAVPNISQYIHWVIAVVIFLSFLPALIGAMRARSRRISKPEACPLGRSTQE